MSDVDDELLVLESIYPDYIQLVSRNDNETSRSILLRLEIPVTLEPPRRIVLHSENLHAGSSKTEPPNTLTLSTLPTIQLDVSVPPDYPATRPPEILSLTSTGSWLSWSQTFSDRITELWSEGEAVLCQWVEYIQNGQFFSASSAFGDADDEIYLFCAAPQVMRILLLEHEKTAAASKFASSSFNCALCFTTLGGSQCIELQKCQHVFCQSCLQEFWSLLIKEGDIQRLTCPDLACVKEGTEASLEDLRAVVTEAEVDRVKWLREKRLVEQDPTIILCPLEFCQRPVLKPPVDDSAGPGWDRLRTCPACSYSFCAYCKRTWHGPVSHCPLPFVETFLASYLESPEGSSERLQIEKRYGRTNVLRLVKQYEEDAENNKWFDAATTSCPGCSVRIQKSQGCNHMTCTKCKQHFCYRCGQRLHPQHVYKHFSTPGHSCYMKLFDEVSDVEWEPMDAFDLT